MGYSGRIVIYVYITVTVLSVLITYLLSIGLGHANAFLPYLSYIGDKPIESTMFTQCFVVDATALMFLVQVRFVQVYRYLRNVKAAPKAFLTNFVGGCTGHAAAAGLFVLACFQESHAYYVHHLAGVFLYFFASILYFTAQTVISCNLANSLREVLLLTRMVLNFLMVFLFLVFEICSAIAQNQFQQPWENRSKWAKDDGGWYLHLLSAESQWLMLAAFQCYFLTFYCEFSKVVITKNRIIVLIE